MYRAAQQFFWLMASLLLSTVVSAQPAPSLDPQVAQDLLKAYEQLENEKYRESLNELNRLLERRGERMKPFDMASVLQVRGTVRVNLNDFPGAIKDFEGAARTGGLPEDQQLRLKFNIAQLYFITEQFELAIRYFEEWMREEEKPNANAYFMLAAAHYNLEDYRKAQPNIEQAIRRAESPEKRHYDLANIVYSELGLTKRRLALLERVVQLWPEEASYWRQLSAMYLEQDRRRDAFSVLEAAYLNGLIDSESEIVSLAQFYAVFNNPHRGAQLLEEEFKSKRVERDVDNLKLLSQLWSQAREHKKAIPVLREAARLSDTGMLSFRLGQSLLADDKHVEAQRAFEAAINKGGLDERARQEVWLLLGTARFNQAGPGDKEQRESADEAFARAERFDRTRPRAADWRRYIAAINDTERRQAALEREQEERLAEAARERLLTGCRAQQLARAELSEECREVLKKAQSGN